MNRQRIQRDVASPKSIVSEIFDSNTLNHQYCRSLRTREARRGVIDKNPNEFELDANFWAHQDYTRYQDLCRRIGGDACKSKVQNLICGVRWSKRRESESKFQFKSVPQPRNSYPIKTILVGRAAVKILIIGHWKEFILPPRVNHQRSQLLIGESLISDEWWETHQKSKERNCPESDLPWVTSQPGNINHTRIKRRTSSPRRIDSDHRDRIPSECSGGLTHVEDSRRWRQIVPMQKLPNAKDGRLKQGR